MKAIVSDEYGSPERLELREIATPTVAANGVLVRVAAASLNPVDWHVLRGEPYVARLSFGLRRPKRIVPGLDAAGHVEKVGPSVTQLRPGDEVFGSSGGAFAEYLRGTEEQFAVKPPEMSFEQAAAVPIAGCSALQALRDHGHLEQGQHILINGASGGVGTFAVQIAKALGAEVTAVCSTRNMELVRSLGADHVVDYTAEDFARDGSRYDLVLNVAGNRSLSDLRRAATSKGTVVLVGAGTGRERGGGAASSPMLQALRALVLSRFVNQRLVSFLADVRKDDLLYLAELFESGKVTPVIDRSYPLSDVAEALRYLEAGHARGKIVIAV
jgi:NADPH:quinone reductase-like Zn-dependent oxidoreductase